MATPQERFEAPWPEVAVDSPNALNRFGVSILGALEGAASRVIQSGGVVLADRTEKFIDEELFGHDLTPDAGITLARDPRSDFIPNFIIGQTPTVQPRQDDLWLWILVAVLAAVALGEE